MYFVNFPQNKKWNPPTDRRFSFMFRELFNVHVSTIILIILWGLWSTSQIVIQSKCTYMYIGVWERECITICQVYPAHEVLSKSKTLLVVLEIVLRLVICQGSEKPFTNRTSHGEVLSKDKFITYKMGYFCFMCFSAHWHITCCKCNTIAI